MKTVVLATNNAHKVSEISTALDFPGWEFKTLRELGIESDPVEDADSFEGNARIKARAAHEASGGLAALADDSGLVVDALDGAPGIYSARYKGLATEHARRMAILDGLRDKPDRSARFICCICYLDADGQPHLFTGVWPGHIALQEEGSNGFGYDPIFIAEDADGHTTASLPLVFKETHSHRARAVGMLMAWMRREKGR